MDNKCTIEGCDRSFYARGYCNTHFSKFKRTGVLVNLPPREPLYCSKIGCKEKHSAKGLCQKHYREFKVERNPMIYKNVEIRRQDRTKERKIAMLGKLGGKCVVCGYNKNVACLDFHHIDPTIKDFEPARLIKMTDMAKIIEELSKCIVLCKNCHNELHHPDSAYFEVGQEPYPILTAP